MIDQPQIAENWKARGFSCEVWIDLPGRRWEDFTHATYELVIVLEGEQTHRTLCQRSHPMQPLIEYEESRGSVREVYDDIRATRQTDDINNFWKALASHPATLQRTWAAVKDVMGGPGELAPLVRELIYLAVSVTNGCDYCIASHHAAAVSRGMTEAMFGELLSIVGLANMTNRLANGFQVPVDDKFQ